MALMILPKALQPLIYLGLIRGNRPRGPLEVVQGLERFLPNHQNFLEGLQEVPSGLPCDGFDDFTESAPALDLPGFKTREPSPWPTRKVRAEVALLFLGYNLKRAVSALGFDVIMAKLDAFSCKFRSFFIFFLNRMQLVLCGVTNRCFILKSS